MSIMREAFARVGIVPTSEIVEPRWPRLKMVQKDREGDRIALVISGPEQDVELYVQEWKEQWGTVEYQASITFMSNTRVLLMRRREPS